MRNPVYVLLWCVALVVGLDPPVNPQHIMYEPLGIAAHPVEGPRVVTGYWFHTFQLQVLCADELLNPNMIDLVNQIYDNYLSIYLQTSNLSLGTQTSAKILYLTSSYMIQGINQAVDQLQELLVLYRQVRIVSESLYGSDGFNACGKPFDESAIKLKRPLKYFEKVLEKIDVLSDSSSMLEGNTSLNIDSELENIGEGVAIQRSRRQSHHYQITTHNSTLNFLQEAPGLAHSSIISRPQATLMDDREPTGHNTKMDPGINHMGASKLKSTQSNIDRDPWSKTQDSSILSENDQANLIGDLMQQDNLNQYNPRVYHKRLLKCKNKCDELCESFTDRSKRSIIETHDAKRKSRSLLDFVGDTYKWLYGTATTKDVELVQRSTRILSAKLDLVAQHMTYRLNESTSLIRLYQSSTIHAFQVINQRLDLLTKHIDDFQPIMAQITASIDRIERVSYAEQIFMLGSIIVNHHVMLVNQAMDNLRLIDNFFRDVVNIRVYKTVPPTIIPPQTVDIALAKLSRALEQNAESQLTINSQELLQEPVYMCYVMNKHVYIVMRIPTERFKEHFTFWKISTIPLHINNAWRRVRSDADIVGLSSNSSRWIALSDHDYRMCMQSKLRDCHHPLTLLSTNITSCSHALVLNSNLSPEVCILQDVSALTHQSMFISYFHDGLWLVSHNLSALHGDVTCSDETLELTHGSQITLSQLALIKIPDQCSVNLMNTLLSPVFRRTDHNDTVRSLYQDQISSPGNRVDILNITVLRPHQVIWSGVEVFKDNHNLSLEVRQSISRLMALMNQNPNNDTDFVKQLANLSSLFREADKNTTISLSTPEFPSLFSWPPTALHYLWYAGICLLSCFIIYGLVTCYRKCFLASPVIAHEMVNLTSRVSPGAFAAHVSGTDNTTLNPVFSSSMAHENITNLISSVTNPCQSLTVTHTQIALHCLGMIVLMGALMVIISKLQKGDAHRMLQLISLDLGYTVRNRKGVVHQGESKLVVCFLMRFYSITGRIITTKVIPVTITSLPGNQRAWYCDRVTDIHNMVISSRVNRLRRFLLFKINWKPVCLKSRDYINLDTCAELPSLIEFRYRDLEPLVDSSDLTWWWSMSICGVTHIMLTDSYSRHVLFNYLTSDGSNQ